MKKIEIPNLVFTKNYDFYFLYCEFDVVFNEEFYENFNVFFKSTGSDRLIIRLEDLSEYENFRDLKKEYIYNSASCNEIESFHNLIIKNIEVYNINHFILDNTHQWEIFVSIENELAIFAVNKNLIEAFKTIFKPYKDEPLSLKFKIISDQFNNEASKKHFISELDKNYKFTSFDLA